MDNPVIHKTILGFDFGMKHIGVAVGQSITRTASPLTTLAAKDGIPHWSEIELLMTQWKPHHLVVGIPLNMDGTEQLMTFCARRFMNRLRTRFKLPTHEADERLSSWEAKTLSFVNKKGGHKDPKKIHAQAAAILVEQWMSEQPL